MSRTDHSGVVAIHRWFSDGEGWAYHPWFQSRLHELLAAVKPELDSRGDLRKEDGVERIFDCEAMGGFLLGKQERDMKCLDPKAAERFPTILRVVHLSRKPSERDTESIMNDLASLHAERAGPSQKLEIAVAQTTPTLKPGPGRGRCFPWLIGAILLTGGLFVGWLAIGTRPPQFDEELRKAEDRMASLLERWQFDVKDKKGDKSSTLKVAQRFLGTLSQDKLGVALEGNHPDVRFFSRMPKKGADPQNKEQLRSALEGILVDLKEAKKPGKPEQPSRSLTSILDDIEQELDYRRWWGNSGKGIDYASSEKADAKVAEHARRFIGESATDRANSGWQRPAAKAMLTELQKWKVEAITSQDVEHRPWLIFHCYFQLLSQHHFMPEELHDDSWQVEFVKRLPKMPLTGDGIFLSEDELIQRLRALAERLGAEKSDTVSTLLTNISSSMDYLRWRKQAEGVIRRDVEKGTVRVDRFVEKFRGNP